MGWRVTLNDQADLDLERVVAFRYFEWRHKNWFICHSIFSPANALLSKYRVR